MRQLFATMIEHLQRQCVPGAELDRGRYSRRFATGSVLRPFLGEIQPVVDQSMLARRDITHADGDLAAIDLAQASAPPSLTALPRDADRLLPLLGERCRIKYNDSSGLANPLSNLIHELIHQRPMVPRSLANELLNLLAIMPMQVGDALAGLVFEVRQQTRRVLGQMHPLSRLRHEPTEGLNERPQPASDLGPILRINLSIA